MKKPYNLLKEPMFREKPGMYLGEGPWLTALFHFINGYNFAMLNEFSNKESRLLPYEFFDWVAYRLEFTDSVKGWKNMILERYPDEDEGFKVFFQLLDEYETRVERPFAYVEMKRKDKPEITERIKLVTYGPWPGFFVLPWSEFRNWPFVGFSPDIEWFESWYRIKRDRLIITDQEEYERILSYEDKP